MKTISSVLYVIILLCLIALTFGSIFVWQMPFMAFLFMICIFVEIFTICEDDQFKVKRLPDPPKEVHLSKDVMKEIYG